MDCLFLSFELKNELTKQNVSHAIKQYKTDRDPNEELFRLGRLLVNFAVDTEEVWMCTQLKGEKSFFLPFNKGNNNGAGNPLNDGIKTDYLWNEVLSKDSLTNILQNYTQLITEEKEYKEELESLIVSLKDWTSLYLSSVGKIKPS